MPEIPRVGASFTLHIAIGRGGFACGFLSRSSKQPTPKPVAPYGLLGGLLPTHFGCNLPFFLTSYILDTSSGKLQQTYWSFGESGGVNIGTRSENYRNFLVEMRPCSRVEIRRPLLSTSQKRLYGGCRQSVLSSER